MTVKQVSARNKILQETDLNESNLAVWKLLWIYGNVPLFKRTKNY